LGRDPTKPFHCAAQVQSLIGPAGHHERRRDDLLEIRSLRFPERIEQRMLDGFLAQILDARRAIPPRVDDAIPPEPGVGNAAVPNELTVGIRPAFPWVD